MIITRKIELRMSEGDLSKVKEMSSLMPRLHNQIVTNIFLNDLIKTKMSTQDELYKSKLKDLDEKIDTLYDKMRGVKDKAKRDKSMIKVEKLKKDRSKLSVEAKKDFDKLYKEAFGKQFDSSTYNILRDDEKLKDLSSEIVSSAMQGLNFYKKDIWKIKNGDERIRFYSKGMPIPTPNRTLKLKYNEESSEFNIDWVKGVKFTMFFGRDKSNNRVIVERVYDGIYKMSDSSIQIKKGKVFLNLCINLPANKNKLDKSKVVGVDLGLAIPAYCSLNDGMDRLSIGSYDEFVKIRTQLDRRRRDLYKNLSTAKGGHGRARKLKAEAQFKEKERNWVKTYNHKISKAIVMFAVKNRASVINLEFLKGYSKTQQSQFVLRNWSYYELQQFVEYKAKIEGIEVKYIDPYHTSQTCSICGNHAKGQRINQAEFECESCGEKMNADYNASRNIAKSVSYVDRQSDCQYFKLKKKGE